MAARQKLEEITLGNDRHPRFIIPFSPHFLGNVRRPLYELLPPVELRAPPRVGSPPEGVNLLAVNKEADVVVEVL